MTKRSLTQLLDECQRDKFKVEREIKPLQEKLSSNRTTNTSQKTLYNQLVI